MSYASAVKSLRSAVAPATGTFEVEHGTTVIAKDGSILVAFTGTRSRVAKAMQANEGAYTLDAVRYPNGFISHLG